MRRRMMKSKIHRATVTGANLDYVGSISLDPELMALADIREYEQVAVLDIDNGARFETYAIAGRAGEVCLNGAAARLVHPGDKVIVITYADYERRRARRLRARGRPRRRAQPASIDEASARLDAELVGAHCPSRRRLPGSAGGPSTSWSSAAASPGCRPRSGSPAARRLARRRPDQGRARPSRPPAGPRAAWPPCWAATRTRRTCTSPTRWPRGRRPVRRRRRAGPRRRGPGPGRRSSSPSAPSSTATPTGALRAGPRGRPLRAPGSSTPAGPRPAPRSSGRWSTPTQRTASAVLEGWFASTCCVEGGRCRGVARAATRRRGRHEVRADARRAGHRRRGPALRGHHQPARVDRRRRRDGPAGRRRRWPTSSSCSSTRPRCTIRPCPGRCCPRRCAGTGRCCATRDGERFVDELAPRDVVSRAMTAAHGRAGRRPPVARRHRPRALRPSGSRRSPPRSRRSASTPSATGCPIAPAAHYLSGGVVTDLDGRHRAPRPVGRAARSACTGVHGANRLASNSLLEGMVFGARLAERIAAGAEGPDADRRAARAVLGEPAARRASGHVRVPDRGSIAGRSRTADAAPATAASSPTSPSCRDACSGR